MLDVYSECVGECNGTGGKVENCWKTRSSILGPVRADLQGFSANLTVAQPHRIAGGNALPGNIVEESFHDSAKGLGRRGKP